MTNFQYKNARNGKIFAGMILILLGSIFFLERLGLDFPKWLISWPMFLIALGAYKGYGQQFRKPWPIVLIIVGSLFLLDDIFPEVDFSGLFWPVIFIAIGSFLILGRNKASLKEQWKAGTDKFDWNKKVPENDTEPIIGTEPGSETGFQGPGNSFSAFGGDKSTIYSDDYIDSVSVFGHVKKNIVSKNFKGGEVVNFMGGAEINLMQADFTGRIVLDVTQVFGGTKIIVPPHWQVNSEMAAIFGGTEDKRPMHQNAVDADKVLIIKGTSIFGGIDIRSF